MWDQTSSHVEITPSVPPPYTQCVMTLISPDVYVVLMPVSYITTVKALQRDFLAEVATMIDLCCSIYFF